MARKLTAWNKAVQKQFKAGKANDADYSFKQALQDASAKMHSSGGNGTDTIPAHNNDPASLEEKPLTEFQAQSGGNEPVGTPVNKSDLVGTPLNASSPSIIETTPTLKHTGGRRRSKKNKSHKKKKGGKSQKKQKKPKHH